MALRIRRFTRSTPRAAIGALCLALIGVATPLAGADTFLDKANAAAMASPGTKPAQDVLMPALAAMTEPPTSTGWARDDQLDLLMAAPGEALWKQLEAWASAEPQQKAIEALKAVTESKDRYILGFGYGIDEVPSDWEKAGLYVGLNDEDLLFSATFPYLERVGWLVGLVSFESARAASQGDGEQALALCMDTVKLGRMLVERPFLREKLAGSSIMLIGLERLRDVMYQFESAFQPAKLKEAADKLKDLRIREIPLPVANKLASDQIVARTFKPRGAVDSSKLAMEMSKAGSQKRPLERLSEAAFWSDRAGSQADWFDTTDKVAGVWADWEKRWRLTDLYDPLFDVPSDFRKMDAEKFLAVYYPMNGVDELFDVRKSLLLEIAGTINSMGCVGFRIAQKTLPPQLASVEPLYVSKTEPDLYNVDRRRERHTFLAFRYWVPIRDQKWDRRDDPHPYEVTVAMMSGAGLFVGGGQNAVDRSMFSQLAPGFNIPAGLGTSEVSEEDMTLDAEKLRTSLTRAFENSNWTPELLRSFTAGFKGIADSGITLENFDDKFEQAFAERSGDMTARMLAIGVDVQEVNGLIKDVCRELLALTSVSNAIETAKRDDTINAEDAKKLMIDAVNAVLQPTYVDRYNAITKKMRDKAKAAIDAAGGEGLPTTVFHVMVDDTQFLLYSVGLDGVDNRARFVGRSGTDTLMWPPVIALQRSVRQNVE